MSLEEPRRQQIVYEVVAGPPTWSRLSRLATDRVADVVTRAVIHAVKTLGRVGSRPRLIALRQHLASELPASTLQDLLEVCVARDRLRCHHNPTDCLSLEFWFVLYNDKTCDISFFHHEFAFPKTR